MPKIRLNEGVLKGLKPKAGRRTEYWDTTSSGGGLVVHVTSTGHKAFYAHYRRRSDGRYRKIKLGDVARLTLADARQENRKVQYAVGRGEDPAYDRQKAKKAETFAELADHWLERHAKQFKKRSWHDDELILKKDLQELGRLKAAAVEKEDVRRAVKVVADRGSLYRANTVLGLVRSIYRWGCDEGIVPHDPTAGLHKSIDPEPRDRVLTDDEIRRFWSGLEAAPMTPAVRLILRLALLTGQRIGEIAGAEKQEFELKDSNWQLPKSRTKNKKGHRVPLSPWTVDLLREAMAAAGDAPYLFPSATTGRPITRKAPSKAFRRCRSQMGLQDVRVHDLRRTVASNIAALGFDRVILAKVLNHTSIDRETVTGAVYDQYSYDKEKREALDAWAGRLEEIVG